MSERVILSLINFTLETLPNVWVAILTGLVDSYGLTLNLSSSLFIHSLVTAFSKKLQDVSATFFSFKKSLSFSSIKNGFTKMIP